MSAAKAPVRVAVTGAAGQIGYSILPRIAAGEMLGPDQPLVLQLLEIPVEGPQKAMRGVAMELDDCAFPLLHGIVMSDDPRVAFADVEWALLIGSKPRGPGMERADLLKDNGAIFVEQGKALDEVAADDCNVVVVGNPCNTNCMIAASQAKRLSPDRFTAMTRLDQNRAQAQLAKKTEAAIADVERIIIFGNHSPTMYADFENATISGRPAVDMVRDDAWLKEEFLPTVGKRGAAIIEARGLSSAASAANAAIDHVRSLATPGETLHSVAIQSDGSYGFADGIWASVPVKTTGVGTYEVDRSFQHSDFAEQKLGVTNGELVEERETVKEMIG